MDAEAELSAHNKAQVWADALLAVAIIALDPERFGGLIVRAHAGPVRDALVHAVETLGAPNMPVRKMPSHIADERLLGGLDMAATLKSGKPVTQMGLLCEVDLGILIVPMAERMEPFTASRLTSVLDQGEVVLERDGITARLVTRFSVVALDEGLSEDERVSSALSDRLAFRCDLSGLSIRDIAPAPLSAQDVARARSLLDQTNRDDDHLIEVLTALATAFGVMSVRSILFAVRTARALAALDGRLDVEDCDIEIAARLVIAPRATRVPMQESAEETSQPEPEEPQSEEPDQREPSEPEEPKPDEAPHDELPNGPLDDTLIEAVEAAIPAQLLAQLQAGAAAQASARSASGQGAQQAAKMRGRPLGARRGRLDGRSRLHLVETLRAAAPWQKLRRSGKDDQSAHVHVTGDDIRVRRYKQREESVTIFCVDASGSAALHRLGEVKGAVELMLAESYARRDYVALITFRGQDADIVMAPTRSLVRAKRALAGVPGGGGTPLAAGLDAGLAVALEAARQGRTPRLVVMTDGQANVGYDPATGRVGARADALVAARRLALHGVATMMIDTSPRMNPKRTPPVAELAAATGALYLALPYPNAQGLKTLVETGTQMQAVG